MAIILKHRSARFGIHWSSEVIVMPCRIFGGIGFDLLSVCGSRLPATGDVVPWLVRSGGLTVSLPSKARDLMPWQRHSPLPLDFWWLPLPAIGMGCAARCFWVVLY